MPSSPCGNAALRYLWTDIRKLKGELIRYVDGDLVIAGTQQKPLKAVPTRPDYVQTDGGGDVTIGVQELDWLIDPEELVDENGTKLEPRDGARIEFLRYGTEYEIRAIQGTEEAWRYSDPSRTWIRIHTGKV
ncbi:MAG: hypothetical protein VX930_03685 [Pseudomonadota bacterium]|nr:hypothetical protein [Pseudomonadota bacterium]MEC7537380.1 hypothetical protein [Pseudomonadota bacterium]MEC9183356.1 hypothetical protein [Pseudomonadota bacterium]